MNKKTYLQVRASEKDKELAENLAEQYNTNVSELIRLSLIYVNEHRPSLSMTMTMTPKEKAPAIYAGGA